MHEKSELGRIGRGAVRQFAACNAIDFLFKLADAGQIPRHDSRTSGATLTSNRLDYLERMSVERCVSRWEALQVPSELSRELAQDGSVGGLRNDLRARIGRIMFISAPMGSGKTLAAERLFQEAVDNARTNEEIAFANPNRL